MLFILGLTSGEVKHHAWLSMHTLSSTSSYYISRVAFQSILHQALIQQAGKRLFGLLGSVAQDAHTLDTIAVLSAASQSERVLEQWQTEGIVCVGVFQMQGDRLPDAMLGIMPTIYVHLSVKLDEKGRLDLLASLCHQSENTQRELPLSLIEDGQ